MREELEKIQEKRISIWDYYYENLKNVEINVDSENLEVIFFLKSQSSFSFSPWYTFMCTVQLVYEVPSLVDTVDLC